MSDNETEEIEEKPFSIERAKQGRAACKKCKQKCLSGELRIAKIGANPFGDGKMKIWHHITCLFNQFLVQRATTKRIESSDDIDGWDNLDENDKEEVLKCIEESEKKIADKHGKKYTAKKPAQPKAKKNQKDDLPVKKNQKDEVSPKKKQKNESPTKQNETKKDDVVPKDHKDNLFREFRRLVTELINESSYLEKTAIIKNVLTKGTDGKSFKGDVVLWCRLLLPGVIKRIYNLQSKQLIKLFSELFSTDREEMLEHLEQGDIGETIQHFFENSDSIKPSKKSNLTLQEVDDFLEELSKLTKEDEQINHFKKMLKRCTANDLKIIIRLIKHDLRMNAGAKHVLDAIHSDAYEAFQASRDLDEVLKRILEDKDSLSSSDSKVKIISINVMTPVLPMLAQACKSVEQAMKKCPNGMYSEIKYDGERVQVHKKGSEFKYYSRSLKPVLPHKVNHFKEYIPQAFPHGNDLILDSEVLLIDAENGKPLPFGSLGKHKKQEFTNANVCLFVFDCIYYNGESLMHKPIKERREILKENMIEISNHIMFSESEVVNKGKDLAVMIAKVLQLGLEGLVLKDLMSIYEPGKRHWLKVKKDYLCEGAMADTADLIVLGAWFGTGKKGGMMSVFLMGCYDSYTKKFLTVTKVHTGHDDKTLEKLQSELDMIKISGEPSRVPNWLKCTRSMTPDFVAKDPKKQPVWEITGAEFTQHDVHTADGISIRFPRVTRIRDDKIWETATTLKELKELYDNSKENVDYDKFLNIQDDSEEASTSTSKQPLIDNFVEKVKKEDTEKQIIKRKSTEANGKSSKKIKTEKEELDDIRFPNIFKNIRILSQEDVSESIWRNFIAHGGDLLTEDNWEEATHVVHKNSFVTEIPEFCPKTARHITIDWIKDSIGNNQIQDTRPYSVTWTPE